MTLSDQINQDLAGTCPCCGNTGFSVFSTAYGDIVPDCPNGCEYRLLLDALLEKGFLVRDPEIAAAMDGASGDPEDPGIDASAIPAPENPEPKAKPKKQETAPRSDYFELFEKVLNNPRRCIFSEKLMTFDAESQLWNPAVNYLEIIKSEALLANEKRKKNKFVQSSIAPHFFAFEASKPAEFLVAIPPWDGIDRISEMAYLVKLRSKSGITETAFSELLKEWCALMFKRLYDPMIQNRILVLQGGQGIGKDTWTSMLVDGLGQFSIPLSIVKEDKDTFLKLHRGLCLKIGEFDKTSRTEVSTLKDIITTPNTDLRAPYDRDSKLRAARCSFIASANVENLLRDPTGNRRFLIFEIEHIEYAYAGWSKEQIKTWQMQCLAEMKELAALNYTASEDSWRQMREYIEEKTPKEYALEISEEFILEMRKDPLNNGGEFEVLPSDENVRVVIERLARQHGIKYTSARQMLEQKIGVFKRVGNKRFWKLVVPQVDYN